MLAAFEIESKAFEPHERLGNTRESSVLFEQSEDKKKQYRRFKLNQPRLETDEAFVSNSVVTSKYTLLNFFPKNIYEQFHRVANIYFLIISCLQVGFSSYSPTNRFATLGPLCVVLFVTMIKEFMEDWKRHLADTKVNNSTASILKDGFLVKVLWSEIQVGDIVHIVSGDYVPADMVLLSCDEERVFMETSGLDGESNLKMRTPISITQHLRTPEQLSCLSGVLKVEPPTKDLYSFSGSLVTKSSICSIDVSNTLWRGVVLKNTHFAFGVVIYTGSDSKLIKNSSTTPSKRSSIDSLVNQAFLVIFLLLFVLVSTSMILNAIWTTQAVNNSEAPWYIPYVPSTLTFGVLIPNLVTYIILFNNLIPISMHFNSCCFVMLGLYVSLEIVKSVQAMFIGWDEKMFYENGNVAAVSRTSNLNENLGQIAHIFSDKTGTLTCNEMRFKSCSINGVIYGSNLPKEFKLRRSFTSTSSFSPLNRSISMLQVPRSPFEPDENDCGVASRIDMFNTQPRGSFDNKAICEDLKGCNGEAIAEFWIALTCCHTVQVDDGKFLASSPDEEALLNAASDLGFLLVKRTSNEFHFLHYGKPVIYNIVALFPFTSERKRMSVVIRRQKSCGEDEYVLYSKGADDVILDRSRLISDVTRDHIHHFSTMGLRILVVAYKIIPNDSISDFISNYNSCNNSIDDRESALSSFAETQETWLNVLGVSGVEDRLQDGVPETIRSLTDAGIKIWMLTGDKLETAINIGYSCNLISMSHDLLKIDEDTDNLTCMRLAEHIKTYKNSLSLNFIPTFALVISGRSLLHILRNRYWTRVLLELSQISKAVIGCRLTPGQKSDLVELIKKSDSSLTLAIGDGGNDVSMIQSAHVGVGLFGNEGAQAVRASDYSIGQFRFLLKLLLCHGHWNYRRVAMNITVVIMLWYFGIFCGYSGTTLYESWLGAGWNVGWTFFPICIFGILDQDLTAFTLLSNPKLYRGGKLDTEFNVWRFAFWIFNGLIHGTIIFFVCYGALSHSNWFSNGKDSSLYSMGTLINACAMMTVNYKIMLFTNFWTFYNFLGFIFSILIWFLFVVAYSFLLLSDSEFYGIATNLLPNPIFWIIVFTLPLCCFLLDLTVCFIYSSFSPNPIDIARELEQITALTTPDLDMVGYDPFSGNITSSFHAIKHDFIDTTDAAEAVRHSIFKGDTGSDVDLLESHLNNLRAILTGNSITRSGMELLSGGNLAQTITMHWFTLSFIDSSYSEESQENINDDSLSENNSNNIHDVRAALEHEFIQASIKKNILFIRQAALLLDIIMIFYSVYTTVNIVAPNRALQWILTGMATVVMLFMWTRVFRRHFQTTLVTIMVLGGIAKTVIIDNNGVAGLAIFVIIVFFVMRSRFYSSIITCVVDLIFYDLYLTQVPESIRIGALEVLFINYLQLVLLFFAASHGYHVERSYRVDFLLQKDYAAEKLRTQKIVDNMLPPYVTKKMKANLGRNEIIANADESCSIMFTEVIHFAELSKIYSPQTIVSILDSIYSAFDELCAQYFVQKMETVGKCYVSCAGLNGTRVDHAHAAVELALEMLRIMRTAQDNEGNHVSLRIGIHSGRVISGVVGHKRPQFSLFGDTVNTSSRMMSTGVEDGIQISQQTAALLNNLYKLDKREVKVKGKGVLETYLIVNSLTISQTSVLNRKRRYVLNSREDDFEGDVKQFVESLEAAEKEPDNDDDVSMNKLTLYFPNSVSENGIEIDWESIYVADRLNKLRAEVRYPILLMVFFYLFEAPIEFSIYSESSIFTIYYVFISFAVVFILMLSSVRYSRHFALHARFYTTLLFFSAVIITLWARFLETLSFNDNFSRPMMIVLLLTTLACNSGITFIDAIVFCFLTIIAFSVAVLKYAKQDESNTSKLFFVIGTCLINLISCYGREKYQRREFTLKDRVLQEKKYADDFLYSMLPVTMAEKLKSGAVGFADRAETFQNVTILYSDIQGFTTYAASSTPEKVIHLLSSLFTKFDELTDIHSVYKVQTIGDAYVIVSGFPFCAPPNTTISPAVAALNCINMAFDMIAVVDEIRTDEGGRVRMRIGIHTGKLVAGCIGTKTLRYDIWGADALCANTLESHGQPSCVVISEVTKSLVESRIPVTEYEVVNVKGIGDVNTYIISANNEADDY